MRTGDNVRLRADGRYEARYAKSRDSRGRIVYGYCYGKTYEEAAAKRQEARRRSVVVREMRLLILGAGSHGREVRELAECLRIFQEVAFLDDDPSNPLAAAIPAAGDRALRMRWLEELAQAGFVLPVLVHPTAVVSPSAKLGYGTVICARATVGSGVSVGCGSIISSGCTIDRGVVLPAGTHLSCGQAVVKDLEGA